VSFVLVHIQNIKLVRYAFFKNKMIWQRPREKGAKPNNQRHISLGYARTAFPEPISLAKHTLPATHGNTTSNRHAARDISMRSAQCSGTDRCK
jgi:hypothetical protein